MLAKIFLAAATIVGTSLFHTGSQSPGVAAGVPVNTVLPEIVGLDTVGSGLYARMGTWTNSPTGYTCRWHLLTVAGTTLSTSCGTKGSPAITLTSGQIGSRVQVDIVAANGAGNSATTLSDFIGPVETSFPALPGTAAGPAPTSLPTYPANAWQNGHYIYPGCNRPPDVPTFTTGAHVWYFDSVNGSDTDTGHIGHPFKTVDALFRVVSGVAGSPFFGFGRTIAPGDTVYIEPNATGATVGMFNNGVYSTVSGTWGQVSAYSTTTGNSSGTTVWTWISTDPAAATNAVFGDINFIGVQGFVFQNLNIEENAFTAQGWANNGQSMLTISGSSANPTTDIVYEGGSLSSWYGHSNDPWDPSTYPTTGGHSDGTIQTASPFIAASAGDGEDPLNIAVTATTGNPTQLFTFALIPGLRDYVWSPGYYYQQTNNGTKVSTGTSLVQNPAPSNTGIPNGTIIQDINGRTDLIPGGGFGQMTTADATHPVAGVINTAYVAGDTGDLWVCNTATCAAGSANWTDVGPMYFTIAPCDTTIDAATGCSVVPIQCDPRVNGAACVGNPTWTGVTRNLVGFPNDTVVITNRMTITPPGWWNSVDWNYSMAGLQTSGQWTGTGTDLIGEQCVSFKNNIIRNVNTTIIINENANTTYYGNRSRFRAQDNVRITTAHRTIIAHNFNADVTYDRGHPDEIQYAQNGTVPASGFLYGNVAVDNEFFTFSDPTDPFPFFSQAIGVTDQVYSGTYIANNIVYNVGSSAVAGSGLYNAVINNTVFQDGLGQDGIVKINSGTKSNINLPAFSLMANNVSNSTALNGNVVGVTNRPVQPTNFGGASTTCASNTPIAGQYTVTMHVGGAAQPSTSTAATGPNVNISGSTIVLSGFSATAPTFNGTYTGSATGNNATTVVAFHTANSGTCPTASEGSVTIGPASCSYDSNTVGPNIVIPSVNILTGIVSSNSTTYCDSASDTITNQPRGGNWTTLKAWTSYLADWRTGQGNPLFNAFNPLPPSPFPAPSGNSISINTCLRNQWTVGTCANPAVGRNDMHPNASFTPTVLTQFNSNVAGGTSVQGGVLGDQFIAGSPTTCNNGNSNCGNPNGQFVGWALPTGVYTRCNDGSTFNPPCTTTAGSTTLSAFGITTQFSLTGTGFGASQGSGSVTVSGVAASISSWSATAISGTLGPSSPGITAALSGTGYGATAGTAYISGVQVSIAAWRNDGALITFYMPPGAAFPTALNTTICLTGQTYPACSGVFGSATLSILVTPNGGGSGTIATAGETGVTTTAVSPYTPGIIGAGVSQGAQQPPANHDRVVTGASINIGAY